MSVRDLVCQVLGDGFRPAGCSDPELRRAFVGHFLGAAEADGKSDAWITGAFEQLAGEDIDRRMLEARRLLRGDVRDAGLPARR